MKALILWVIAWAITVLWAPALWLIPVLGFLQSFSHTFVSRGRNSGSLTYHVIASMFANGVYAGLLVFSINIVAYASDSIGLFVTIYVLSTMSGSVVAHAVAKRYERGAARNIQEDRVAKLETQLQTHEAIHLETVELLRSMTDISRINHELIGMQDTRLKRLENDG